VSLQRYQAAFLRPVSGRPCIGSVYRLNRQEQGKTFIWTPKQAILNRPCAVRPKKTTLVQ